MNRPPRAAAQAAFESLSRLPAADASDEEMADVPQVSTSQSAQGSPRVSNREEKSPTIESGTELQLDPENEQSPQPNHEIQTAHEQSATDLVGENPPMRPETPTHSGGRASAIPRKRRIGRPPKYPRPELDAADDTGNSQIRVTTPAKRRRGRPAASGGRWARNRGPSHITQPPVDKDGNVMQVVDDEVVVPGDPEGDTKVDRNGHLQDGREYRVRTFTLLNRGEKLYMLSTEPARCIGFRDSYLFFQKHRLLYKIIIDDDAKRDLIERDILPHSYKGRAIGVVTARSVFREFGAKIVVGGKKITDDYNAKEARERGDIEGEIAVPEDRLPPQGEPYNRNQFVAWHGASSVYHTAAPAVPLPTGKSVDSKKRKVTVTGDNWMLEHAREASTFNSSLLNSRLRAVGGVYEVHTNAMQYLKSMQPTHARWEYLPSPSPHTASKLTGRLSTLNLDDETSVEGGNEPSKGSRSNANDSILFSSIPPALSRRFAIHDTVYESPPYSNQGIPGSDGDLYGLSVNGLVTITESPQHGPKLISPEILSELPLECKEALVEAATREWEWKSRWRCETDDGQRLPPLKSYSWFP